MPAWMASLMKPLRFFRKTASLSGLAPWNTPAMPSGCIPMLVRFSTLLRVGPSVQEGPSLSDLTDCVLANGVSICQDLGVPLRSQALPI